MFGRRHLHIVWETVREIQARLPVNVSQRTKSRKIYFFALEYYFLLTLKDKYMLDEAAIAEKKTVFINLA